VTQLHVQVQPAGIGEPHGSVRVSPPGIVISIPVLPGLTVPRTPGGVEVGGGVAHRSLASIHATTSPARTWTQLSAFSKTVTFQPSFLDIWKTMVDDLFGSAWP
jgi:hypothetical protein